VFLRFWVEVDSLNAGSRINFSTTFPDSKLRSEFRNEILRSALLDIQVTLLCVCGVDSFIPELEHLIENLFHGLFSKKKPLKSDSWIQIPELKLRSTSSAEKNFAHEITWITWKAEQNLEIWKIWTHFSSFESGKVVEKLILLPA